MTIKEYRKWINSLPKELDGFENLWVNRSKPPDVRQRETSMRKIKRAVCEVTACEGRTVVSDYRKFVVYAKVDGKFSKVAEVDPQSNIKWETQVLPEVRSRTAELLVQA